MKWDRRFLDLAAVVASWSKDPSTRCGAVITRLDNTVASLGFNGFARGMDDSPELYSNREEKLSRVIHAEMNALLTAKEPLTGYTLYVFPFSPCERCAVHIIQSGIQRVVFRTASAEQLERWKDSFEQSLRFFKEAGVSVEMYP